MKKNLLLLLHLTILAHSAWSNPYIKTRTFDASNGVDVFGNAIEDGDGYWWFQPIEYRQPPVVFDGKRFDLSPNVYGDRGLQALFTLDYYKSGNMVDSRGTYWWCSTRGIYNFKHGKLYEHLDKGNGLPTDSVITVQEHASGSIWIATVKGFFIIKKTGSEWRVQKKRPRLQLNKSGFLKTLNPEDFYANPASAPRYYLHKASDGGLIYGYYDPSTKMTKLEWISGASEDQSKGSWEIPGQVDDLNSDASGILVQTELKSSNLWLLRPGNPTKNLSSSLGTYIGWLSSHEALFQIIKPGENHLVVHQLNKLSQLELPHDVRVLSMKAPELGTLRDMGGYKVLLGANNFDPFEPMAYKNGQWISTLTLFPDLDLKDAFVFQKDDKNFFVIKKQIRGITQVHINTNVQVVPFPAPTNGLFIQTVAPNGKSLVVQPNENNPLEGKGLGLHFTTYGTGAFSSKPSFGKSRRVADNVLGGAWFVNRDTSLITFLDGRGDSIRIALGKPYSFQKALSWRGYFMGLEENGWAWLVDTGSRKTKRFKMPSSMRLETFINQDGIQLLDSVKGLYYSTFADPEKFSLVSPKNYKKPIWFSSEFPTWLDQNTVYVYEHGALHSNPIPDSTYANIRAAERAGNRILFFAGNIQPNYRDMLCWDGKKWSIIPLAKPIRVGLGFISFPKVWGTTEGLYVLNEGRLLEYRASTGWRTLCNLAEWMGFVWSSTIANGTFYATGWSRNLVEIDLSHFEKEAPKLNFHLDSLQSQPRPKFAYGADLILRWKATEFLSNTPISYRSRLVRLDDQTAVEWVDEGSNESRILSFLPAGAYRFELMAKGDQDVWCEPISFSFVVLAPWYERWYWRAFFVLAALGLLTLIVYLNQARLKRINLRLQQKIDSATEEIRTQNQQLEHQHQEILDSIEYAKRIQGALLPGPKMIKEYLVDSFILYLPKDVVAGDFYWMERKGPWLWFAVCDCTGHGVPGAMVSVVCHNALNRAVNEFGCTLPGEILDKVAELVLDNFSNDQDVKDGMDASLCAWNLDTQTIYWSGANNPLWIMGKQGLSIVKPDKQAIGQIDNRVPYTTHQLSLESGDVLYLFTDGFADQFGGPKGKKLTRSKFQEWLQELGNLNMDEQRKRLLEQHLAYRGNLPQVDDVCIMGLRPFS